MRLEEGFRRLEFVMLPSGGFGYHPGGDVFVEPTALALLAVAPDPAGSIAIAARPTWTRSVDLLLSLQHAKGFFGAIADDTEPSWATSPALLALLAHERRVSAAAAGRWLSDWRAPEKPFKEEFRVQMRKLLRIDAGIGGWPWQAGEAFATVEPTAFAAIALRSWNGDGAQQRIDEARRYLGDRVCRDGGWNYGNPYFYDSVLSPITLPTAKGLLAVLLCGEPPGEALISRAVATLSRLLTSNPSRKAHAWGALAFAAFGDRVRAAEHAEMAVDPADGRGRWGGSPDATALTVLALRAAAGRAPLCLTVQPI
jgi:hypothetical protein